MTAKHQQHNFNAAVGKVLQMMIHSIYTNKEIFLRMQTMKKINNYIEIKDTNINNTQQTKKFNFVYFLSEGPPHDNGLNLIENKTILEENAKPHFDNIAFYTPRKMIEYGLNNYVKDYKTEGSFKRLYKYS